LYKDGEWVVSPAYDLVYSHGFRGNHSTTVLGSGSPDRETMLKAGMDAGLQNADCGTIYSEVEEATRELVAMIKRRFLL
jgi:serine/threonine-protein kinase HipA